MATKPLLSLPSRSPALKGQRHGHLQGSRPHVPHVPHATPAQPRRHLRGQAVSPSQVWEERSVGHRPQLPVCCVRGTRTSESRPGPGSTCSARTGRPTAHLHAERLHADDKDLPSGSGPQRVLRHQQAPDGQHAQLYHRLGLGIPGSILKGNTTFNFIQIQFPAHRNLGAKDQF